MSLLKVTGLNKSFGSLHILKNVNLEVQPEERHVIIGPNGAGKTTVFNCITGVLPTDSGTVELEGKAIGTSSLLQAGASRHFANVSEKQSLFKPHGGRKPRAGDAVAKTLPFSNDSTDCEVSGCV